MKKRKIIGIDYGDFSIGLAIFDLETDFIYPYKTIFREKANILRKSIREIVEIVKNENITDIVIGLPLNSDGTEGDRVEKVKNFSKMLINGLVYKDINVKNVNELLEMDVKYDSGQFDMQNVKEKNLRSFDNKSELIVSIYFQDERLTTVEAKSILQEKGIKKIEWKKNIDQIAAEIILQDFKQSNNL